MDYTGCGAYVNEPMEHLPSLAAQASNPARGGGDCQRQHHYPGGHSGGDEPALGDVGQHFMDIEKLVEPDVRHQVERAVEECEEAEHAAQIDEPILAG